MHVISRVSDQQGRKPFQVTFHSDLTSLKHLDNCAHSQHGQQVLRFDFCIDAVFIKGRFDLQGSFRN